jgi:ssDNA-binding replication factor A large subunit
LRREKLKINELRLGMNNININAKVVDVSEPREVMTKLGYRTRVATATIEDDTGKIELSLWGKQIDEIGEGDTIEITSGYTTEFRGSLQLNVPRKGGIKKVG